MCACVYVCACVSVYVFVCVFVHLCVGVGVGVGGCEYLCVFVCWGAVLGSLLLKSNHTTYYILLSIYVIRYSYILLII